MAKLYTGSGDKGTTWCGRAGGRVSKTHPCIEFIGCLDEAEAAVGLARSLLPEEMEDLAELLAWVEDALFRIGFTVNGKNCVTPGDVEKAEAEIDRLSGSIEFSFTLNGGHPAAAATSLARAVARRAERRLWSCLEVTGGPGGDDLLAARLLNRLSDLLYAVQLEINRRTGHKPGKPSCTRGR